MSLFLDRRRRSSRHLVWKVRLFSVAAVVALTGMYFNDPRITGVAIVLLLVGLLLRFLPERERESGADGSGPE